MTIKQLKDQLYSTIEQYKKKQKNCENNHEYSWAYYWKGRIIQLYEEIRDLSLIECNCIKKE